MNGDPPGCSITSSSSFPPIPQHQPSWLLLLHSTQTLRTRVSTSQVGQMSDKTAASDILVSGLGTWPQLPGLVVPRVQQWWIMQLDAHCPCENLDCSPSYSLACSQLPVFLSSRRHCNWKKKEEPRSENWVVECEEVLCRSLTNITAIFLSKLANQICKELGIYLLQSSLAST